MKRFLSLLLLFSCSAEQHTHSSLIVSEDNSSDTVLHLLHKDEKVTEQVIDTPYVTANDTLDTLQIAEIIEGGYTVIDTVSSIEDKTDCSDQHLELEFVGIEQRDTLESDSLVETILVHSFYSAADRKPISDTITRDVYVGGALKDWRIDSLKNEISGELKILHRDTLFSDSIQFSKGFPYVGDTSLNINRIPGSLFIK